MSSPSTVLDPHAHLLTSVRGPVLRPGDEDFAREVAGFNLAHRPRPRVVVGATCPGDVQAAVRYARAAGLRVRVQATGHGLHDDLAGTVLITTRRLTTLAIDPKLSTARIGAGLSWRPVIDAAAEHGLAPLCGSSSSVGAIGYTLGGGVGALTRRYGFAADAVRSLTVVTGEGELRYVDVRHHADLFWALRGGRDGLGVVVEVVVDLVPVARMRAGGIFYPGTAAREVLSAWRRWAPNLPREVATSVALLRLPPDPALPEPLRGQFVVHLRYSHSGSASSPQDDGAADRWLAPLRTVAPSIVDTVGELPFTAVDTIHADPTNPMPVHEGGTGLGELTEEALDALLARTDADSDCALALVELRLLGGRSAQQPRIPNAATGRGAGFSLLALGVPAGPDAGTVVAQVRDLREALAPWSCPGPLNLSSGADPRTLWTDGEWERLEGIRRRHDPTGVFSATR